MRNATGDMQTSFVIAGVFPAPHRIVADGLARLCICCTVHGHAPRRALAAGLMNRQR